MMENNRDGKFHNYKFMKHNRLVPSGWMRWGAVRVNMAGGNVGVNRVPKGHRLNF